MLPWSTSAYGRNPACWPRCRAQGNCDDNAPMESVWGRLKTQLVHHQRYDTRAEADASIREYIEIFYNRQRRHSRLGNVAAAVFAQQFCKPPRAA